MQSLIEQTLTQPDNLAWLRQALAANAGLALDAFSGFACACFGFVDEFARPQTAHCAGVLRKLARQGLVVLNDAPGCGRPAAAESRLPQPSGLPGDAGAIGKLKAVRAESDAERRIWRAVMQEGPGLLQATPPGPLLRYLAYADGQLAGACGFCQARRRDAERDRWIGWDDDRRGRRLNACVVWMHAFLVRRGAQGSRGIAPQILDAVLGAVQADWRASFGTEPLLAEALASPGQFEASAFRAPGWIAPGGTAMPDAGGLAPEARGAWHAFVHPFASGLRERLDALPAAGGDGAQPPAPGVPGASGPSGPEDGGFAAHSQLKLVLVKTPEQDMFWNSVMEEKHELGAGGAFRRQKRYLVYVQGKLVAAGGFGTARKAVLARDAWIGWTGQERSQGLLRDAVVRMHRFLVLEDWRAAQDFPPACLLALLGAVQADWRTGFGTEPLLAEIYVLPNSFEEACCKAAGLVQAGRALGRGPDDMDSRAVRGQRLIYMHSFVPDFRKRLAAQSAPCETLPAWAKAPSLSPWEGLKQAVWASSELEGADVGRHDRSERLVVCADRLASGPFPSASRAFGGSSSSAMESWYRLADSESVTPEGILGCHAKRTLRRAKALKTVLFLLEGSEFSLEGKPRMKAVLERWRRSSGEASLHLQAAAAVDPERNLFLGIVKAAFWCAKDGQNEASAAREHCRHLDEAAGFMPDSLAVIVCAPGACEARFLSECLELGHCRIIVPAGEDEILPGESGALGALMAQTPPCGTMRLAPGRLAEGVDDAEAGIEVDIACRRFALAPPPEGLEASRASLVCVAATERTPPAGRGRLSWMLLTTLAVESFGDACRVVEHYAARRISLDWLDTLRKAFDEIEMRACMTARRLQNILAVYMAVSWWKRASCQPAAPSA